MGAGRTAGNMEYDKSKPLKPLRGVVKGEAVEVLSALPDRSVGACISDPPFFTGIGRPDADTWGFGHDPWENLSTVGDATLWATLVFHELARVTRKGGAVVVMAGVHAVSAWMAAAENAGLIWMAELVVLWNTGKPRQRNFGSLHTHILWFAVPGARHVWNHPKLSIYSNIIVCHKVPIAERSHPAQKPVELTNFLISLLTKQDDVILDPFCGSGSTLVSASNLGRPFVGIEREDKHWKSAKRRVAHAEMEEEKPLYLWVNGRLEQV